MVGTSSLAEEAAEPASWDGNVDLGYLATSGNSETESLNFATTASRSFGVWTHNFELQAINSSDSGTRSTERYLGRYQLDRDLTERSFLFGRLEYEHDRFGGVLDRTELTGGYGYRFLTGPTHLLDGEFGLGFSDLEFSDLSTTDQTTLSAKGSYTWNISDTSVLTQTLRYDAGEDNDYLESETALSVTIIGSLAVKFSYLIKSNSDVPVGTEETDTYTSVALSYSF